MNSKLMLLVAAAGAAILFAADQPKKEPTEFDKLKAKVSVLEGRIAVLENRIDLLSHTPKVTFEPPNLQLHRDNAIPPHIGEGEVNGMKYYIVPLSGSTATPEARPQ